MYTVYIDMPVRMVMSGLRPFVACIEATGGSIDHMISLWLALR